MDKRKRKLLRMILLAGMVACLIPMVQACFLSRQHKSQQEALKKRVEAGTETLTYGSSEPKETGEPFYTDTNGLQTETEPGVLRKYADLYLENKDLIGWLSIEGTNIDYPVMQNEDDEYYLRHDFYGNKSKYGCLYVKKQAEPDDGTNFIIYGHNMKDGTMFGELDNYEKESFYQKYPTISFDTLYEERTYEIIAVFHSQVYEEEEDAFQYYQFYEADTQEKFDDFYNNIKALSLYDTGVEAQLGDTFLTLSTCAYHVTDGRFVVVAKRRI